MTTLFLARHGETVWHAEYRYCGRTDVGLTDRGVGQARRLAEWAAGAGLDAVWSSNLSRARAPRSPVSTRPGSRSASTRGCGSWTSVTPRA